MAIIKYFLLLRLKHFKIESLEAPTSAICNHKINHKSKKRLGQHVGTTLMFIFLKK